jgi:hypothetical protein
MPRCSLACLLLLGVSSPSAHALQPIQVGEGVYAFIGDLGEIGPDNGGDIGNSGFIVGSSGVIVIDTGISYRHGKACRAIRRMSDKPVELVVALTPCRNSCSAAPRCRSWAHRSSSASAAGVRERCQHYADNAQDLGQEAMARTRLVLPQRR